MGRPSSGHYYILDRRSDMPISTTVDERVYTGISTLLVVTQSIVASRLSRHSLFHNLFSDTSGTRYNVAHNIKSLSVPTITKYKVQQNTPEDSTALATLHDQLRTRGLTPPSPLIPPTLVLALPPRGDLGESGGRWNVLTVDVRRGERPRGERSTTGSRPTFTFA